MKITHFVTLCTFLLSGCASMTSDSMQPVSLNATYEGKPIDKADCTLINDKGTWKATTPGTALVHKSSSDLNVECKKEGIPNGLLRVISRAAGGMFGNIILGGGIGAVIDHSTGNGYNYPQELMVKMGLASTADAPVLRGTVSDTNAEK